MELVEHVTVFTEYKYAKTSLYKSIKIVYL